MQLNNNEINLEEIAKDQNNFKTIINNAFIEKKLELEEKDELIETNSKQI